MAATFELEVITPERTVFRGTVRSITVPAEGGSLGVLAHHAPLLCPVETGAMKVVLEDGTVRFMLVSEGFLEVAENRARVLAQVGELESEIDLARAEAAEVRARARLRERSAQDLDLARAEAALARALTREAIVRDLAPRFRARGAERTAPGA